MKTDGSSVYRLHDFLGEFWDVWVNSGMSGLILGCLREFWDVWVNFGMSGRKSGMSGGGGGVFWVVFNKFYFI
jgi:hypothetical protein